jgi:two-component system sensor histidine kinase DesK
MLASAGIDCQLRVPGAYSLPPAVDALLAWTVREGATNIVRHSAATHAKIVIELTGTEASAKLSDDGAGPRGKGLRAIAGGSATAGFGLAGSGLAGLAERAARLGGTLSAGAGENGGFWLRVSVPLTGTPADGAADPARSASSDPSAPPNREPMPS